jgi:hypothetical protein
MIGQSPGGNFKKPCIRYSCNANTLEAKLLFIEVIIQQDASGRLRETDGIYYPFKRSACCMNIWANDCHS